MKTRIIYGLLSALFMWLYWLTWQGAVVFIIILVAFLLVYLLTTRFRHHPYYGLGACLLAVILFVFLGDRYIGPFYPMWPIVYTTTEMQRLTLLAAWQNFGITTFLVPVILGLLGYQAVKRGGASLVLLLVWSVIMLVAMLEYRRFAYYFAVNIALLSGWFAWYAWQRLRNNLPKALALMAILCILIVAPSLHQATAKYKYHTPSDAWCETLTWIEGNTPKDSLILAWWDYGYWIQRVGERKTYVNPGQDVARIAKTANMFLSPTDGNSVNADYLILDYSTVTNKLWSITMWADKPAKHFYGFTFGFPRTKVYYPEYYNSLMARLYFDGHSVSYSLIYSSEQEVNGIPEIKVFKRRRTGVGL